MIVYVESNFILELAFLREEHISCESILALSDKNEINLVLPAFSVGESYEAWVRRYKHRTELHNRLTQEIRELSRSTPYEKSSKDFQELTNVLVKSGEEEKQRLDDAISRILATAEVIPIGLETIKTAIQFQRSHTLSPQDSIVYASVLAHLSTAPGEPKCFLTKNSKDFANPDIYKELNAHNCKLLTKFSDGLGYIQSFH